MRRKTAVPHEGGTKADGQEGNFMKRSTVTVLWSVFLAVLVSASAPARAQGLDHFTGYAVGSGLDGPTVSLVDQFQTQDVNLLDARLFFVPVNKNSEGINDPVGHLTCYEIPGGDPAPPAINVTNQFGTQTLSLTSPELLCVPTEKNPPQSVSLDHYKCYAASGDNVATPVSLVDQFRTQPLVSVTIPFAFCNPVEKDGELIVNTVDHLTCYLTLPPGSVSVGLISIENQFHSATLEVGPPFVLCAPSTKEIIASVPALSGPVLIGLCVLIATGGLVLAVRRQRA
jgi:hypothetical protein